MLTAYNNLGEVWDILGDAKKAIEYFEKANVTIPFTANSNDYVNRLKLVLGENIVRINSNENSVSFPLLWLRQLGSNAIGELSTELKANFQRFLKK